jgi:hypothetical protein
MQSPEIKRAMSVSVRVEEIAEEVLAERREKFCTNLQSLVWNCAALASQWRALVEFISTSANCGKHIDYRAAGEILRPAAAQTLTNYSDVQEMAKSSPCELHGLGDLTLGIIEAGNVIRWLDSWPTNDDSRRNASRESFARGELCTDPDLVG